jgi:hypothetical protein
MIHRRALPLLALGVLACARPPQVEPRHPPASLFSEEWKMPGPIRADARGFRPECAALVPYEVKPPIIRPKADLLVLPKLPRLHVEGVMSVEALIDETGHVCDARLLKRIAPLSRWLDEPIRNSVLQARFQPATFGNVPVPVVYLITFRWELGYSRSRAPLLD